MACILTLHSLISVAFSSTSLVMLATMTEFSLSWSPKLSILEVSFSIASTRDAFKTSDESCVVLTFEGGAVLFFGVTGTFSFHPTTCCIHL